MVSLVGSRAVIGEPDGPHDGVASWVPNIVQEAWVCPRTTRMTRSTASDDRPERHWNTHRDPLDLVAQGAAKKFADGLYEKERSAKERELEPGFVHTANLDQEPQGLSL